MAKDRISKTSHGFTRNFTDASQEVYQPCSRLACCQANSNHPIGVEEPIPIQWDAVQLFQVSFWNFVVELRRQILSDLSVETIASAVGCALR